MRFCWTLVWLLFLTGPVAAQSALPLDAAHQRITYTDIVRVDSMQREQLYTQTAQWLHDTYRASNKGLNVLIDDRDNGIVVVRGSFIPAIRQGRTVASGRLLWYTLQLDLQEGFYTYTLKDYELENPGASTPVALEGLLYTPRQSRQHILLKQQYEQQITDHARQLIQSLKLQLHQQPDGEIGPNWH